MNYTFKTIDSAKTLKGKRVLVRVDFNVPIIDSQITDDFRIRRSLETINYLVEKGGKVILISHMSGNEVNSLKPVAESLPRHLKVTFLEDMFSPEAEKVIDSLKDGEVLLFENLRKYSGEKENDPRFAEDLASVAEIFVNEAFSVSHREHASVVGIPEHLPSYAGFLFKEEVENLSKALEPEHPFLFLLGGAKFDTKIPLALKFAEIADHVMVAGAISNEFFEEKHMEIGKSLSSPDSLDEENSAFRKIILPLDVRVVDGDKLRTVSPDDIQKEDRIVDIGHRTLEKIEELSKGAKLILWNGPVGEYKEGYKETSLEVARIISESDAMTITGGGDTLSAISEIKVEEKFSFVSTAGGAMLEFLAEGTLPGIEALENSKASIPKS